MYSERQNGGRKASLSCGTGHRKYNNCLFLMRAEKALEISPNMAFLVSSLLQACQDCGFLIPCFGFVFYLSGLNTSDYYMQKGWLLFFFLMWKLSLVFFFLAGIVLFFGGNHKSGLKGKRCLNPTLPPFSKEWQSRGSETALQGGVTALEPCAR